ncbi:hypothetical protein M8818_002988 [Zalaria obscura]|uniref:Uncharacterized protein n=1 Tax=Zalaria obscura TaxID=2024903 RepID=A0ACC3SG78_9PEZI
MSDLGRKDLSSSVKDSVTPDSQKSTFDSAKDSVTGTADRVAGAVQPEDQKSTSQKAADTFSSNKDSAQGEGKSYLQSAQDTLSSAAQSVQDSLSGTGNSKSPLALSSEETVTNITSLRQVNLLIPNSPDDPRFPHLRHDAFREALSGG